MKKVEISGVGIHSGVESSITVRATDSGGIVFIRNGVRIPALYKNVANAMLRNTAIGIPPNEVTTIEHFMAAMFVCGIANAEIEIDGPEMPILDGAAAELIGRLKGLVPAVQSGLLVVKNEVVARRGELDKKLPWWIKAANFICGRRRDGYVKLSPSDGKRLEIFARLIYKEPVIGDQKYAFVFDYGDFGASAADFEKTIAKARTFGTVGEWEWLKRRGMGRGANERNVIALGTISELERLQRLGLGCGVKAENITSAGKNDVVALTRLYYPDEFVRHKIIDIVGDLYMSGFRVAGKIDSFKGSHALNNLALRKLFSNAENYDIIPFEI
ncbi:MAG: UDP-3-O-acyl-N-acetylglucosamine deacetylase [Rickettsiales bacterium]|jgi:UDP-3-O-[3-hydroxymyristoyl] N-acetylglucosamine deacetylase|nr:UDP-3-O-acyl-N-acetylglucosamine deacetylase [Rickettsiales bacterium]